MSFDVAVDPGAAENGLALMLAQLVEENLQDPAKRADFDRLELRLGIVASDAGVRLTMIFSRGRLAVYDGLAAELDLMITTTSEKITALSLLPIRRLGPLRLPDYASAQGRAIVADLVRGDVKIRGLLRHPIALTRLTRLLSVAGS
ncbi:MAG: hypothetical protein AABZ30_01400 [Myxococcota bacterium]